MCSLLGSIGSTPPEHPLAVEQKLFVYGALRHGEDQSGWVHQLHCVTGKVRGSLYQLPAGTPALQAGGEGWVYGELLSPIDDRLLKILDLQHGVEDRLFQRQTIEVLVGLVRHLAWAYTMKYPDRRGGKHLSGGRWRRTGWK
jgi:gamma-glutamylcyclotransferase (GGCT)/AIG2-like uncharacterized protein YtfP